MSFPCFANRFTHAHLNQSSSVACCKGLAEINMFPTMRWESYSKTVKNLDCRRFLHTVQYFDIIKLKTINKIMFKPVIKQQDNTAISVTSYFHL